MSTSKIEKHSVKSRKITGVTYREKGAKRVDDNQLSKSEIIETLESFLPSKQKKDKLLSKLVNAASKGASQKIDTTESKKDIIHRKIILLNHVIQNGFEVTFLECSNLEQEYLMTYKKSSTIKLGEEVNKLEQQYLKL